MNNSKLNTEFIIELYKKGESLNSIAKRCKTHATTISRILEKNNIELRHDNKKSGEFYVENGEKLIEWAKNQNRPVTKTELAQLLGRSRLSPSYFMKYPELKQYMVIYSQDDLKSYYQQLYDWLQQNNIPYKLKNKQALGVSVTALLLEPYNNIAIQIDIRSYYVSKKRYEEALHKKIEKAKERGIKLLLLKKEHFKDLNCVKDLLDDINAKNKEE